MVRVRHKVAHKAIQSTTSGNGLVKRDARYIHGWLPDLYRPCLNSESTRG